MPQSGGTAWPRNGCVAFSEVGYSLPRKVSRVSKPVPRRSAPARGSLLTLREAVPTRPRAPSGQAFRPPLGPSTSLGSAVPASPPPPPQPPGGTVFTPLNSPKFLSALVRTGAEIFPHGVHPQLFRRPQTPRKREGASGAVPRRRFPGAGRPGPSPSDAPRRVRLATRRRQRAEPPGSLAWGHPPPAGPRAARLPRPPRRSQALRCRFPPAVPGVPAHSSRSRLAPLPAGAAAPLSAPPPPSCISNRLHFSGSQL